MEGTGLNTVTHYNLDSPEFAEEFGKRYWAYIEGKRGLRLWKDIIQETGISKLTLQTAEKASRTLDILQTILLARALIFTLDELVSYCTGETLSKTDGLYEYNFSLTVSELLWKNLDMVRESRKMRWSEIAAKSRLPKSTLSSAKSSSHNLSFLTAYKLARSVDCSLTCLCGEADTKYDTSPASKLKNSIVKAIESFTTAELQPIYEMVQKMQAVHEVNEKYAESENKDKS